MDLHSGDVKYRVIQFTGPFFLFCFLRPGIIREGVWAGLGVIRRSLHSDQGHYAS